MVGIKEILNKMLYNKPLTEEEKMVYLNSKRIKPEILEYLCNCFKNLYIEILAKYEGNLFELMKAGKLEGWCWQTTESAIVFLKDDDYIERGNLKLDDKTLEYYHSWICFKYDGVEYILDPCLNILCKKSDYFRIFEVKVLGKVSSKEVKEELIRQITTKDEKVSEIHKEMESFWKRILGNSYESKKDEVVVHGPEDVNTPLYRNGAGYKTKIEDGKIKKMTVHYYYNDL